MATVKNAETTKPKLKHQNPLNIFLIGNPNVGKSVIFGLLTGRYTTVSNYPGTTVEVSHGNAGFGKHRIHIVDTPGVNNLMPMSEDEKVTRDILLLEKADAIIQVADSKNMKRTLLLTLQLIEMGLPVVLDLNMADEAESKGLHINVTRLSELLDVEVVSTIAVHRKGIDSLKHSALRARLSNFKFTYEDAIEESITRIEAYLPNANISRRSIAIMLLAGDKSMRGWLNANIDKDKINKINAIRYEAETRYREPINYVINQNRMKVVDEIANEVVIKKEKKGREFSVFIGNVSMHPIWGVPVLILVLWALYEFVGRFGAGTLVNLLERNVFGEYINPWMEKIVRFALPWTSLQELFIGPYGVFTMALTYSIAIILPITLTFFIAFGILEDSGYMPRLALMLNKVFRLMGLNGKAVLPMILGLGCDTMATMTARILETKKEKIIVTLLLALGVPCSAQLGAILGMFGTQPISAVILWGGVVTGIILLVGYLGSKVIPGERPDFVLEIPPLRIPQASNVLIKTVSRIEWYLREAVPLFILGTLILFIADKLRILPVIEEATEPVVTGFLGLPPKAAEAFLLGFLRRDYGAAGLFTMEKQGLLNTHQVVVSLVTITLFIPCIANFFIIVKERGLKTAMWMAAFIFPFAFLVGGLLNWTMNVLGIFA